MTMRKSVRCPSCLTSRMVAVVDGEVKCPTCGRVLVVAEHLIEGHVPPIAAGDNGNRARNRRRALIAKRHALLSRSGVADDDGVDLVETFGEEP